MLSEAPVCRHFMCDQFPYQEQFPEAMEKFFNANGDEQLPREYHEEERNRDVAMAAAQH